MSPLYDTQYPPPFLSYEAPLNTFLVFNGEALVTGKMSQQVSLPIGPVAGPKGIRVEVDFNQNPGVFELDVVEVDDDTQGQQEYQLVPTAGQLVNGNLTSGPNGASTHISSDLIPVAGQMVAIYVKTQPANAGTTARVRITRAA